jgi:hypothetical protein
VPKKVVKAAICAKTSQIGKVSYVSGQPEFEEWGVHTYKSAKTFMVLVS